MDQSTMNSTYKELGILIRDHREKKGLTQFDVAQNLGYDSAQFVSLFERGLAKVPLEILGRLIVLLSLPEKRVMNALMDAYKNEVMVRIGQGKKQAAG